MCRGTDVDQARTFNEKFTVHFTKLDGTTATISNQ
jgi:hypothetical protein